MALLPVILLGALGLVNIALVTVKQRVREIGIRRSFGATAGRVFFAVMMESAGRPIRSQKTSLTINRGASCSASTGRNHAPSSIRTRCISP